MRRSLLRLIVGAVCLLALSPVAYAQSGSSTTSLSGTVVDKDDRVVPGASVVVKNNATGVSKETVTNETGAYSFPAIDAGTYTVTIALQGFKTAVVTDVRVLAATPATLRTVLEIGALSETIEVKGRTELVRTQSPTVTSTVSAELISNLPVLTRNVLNFLIFLPGVQTTGGSGNARNSTISGLPQNTINITIDGINNSNNLQSGDGFFSMVVPRLDAIEEVTISTATAGADSTGQGATQIRFVTKSGTNVFTTSLYEYLQHKSLNSNTFFNRIAGLQRPRRTINQYGGRVGGPIVIPGWFDGHNKAFFFFNQEEVWQPNETRRTRTVLNDAAILGNFTYNTTNPRTVNVLQLAAANGQTSTYDPTILALFDKIRDAMKTTGTLQAHPTNPNTAQYNWLVPVSSVRHNPVGSVDINLSAKHHFRTAYWWQKFNDEPDTLNSADPVFPGFPLHAHQASYRTNGSASFRSTLSPNLVNEVLSGWQWSPLDFFGDITPDRFDNQGGYSLTLVPNNTLGLSNITPGNFGNAPELRDTPNWNIDDNLSWLKGKHSFTFGFSFTQVRDWIDDWNVVPSINFGVNTDFDPAAPLFAVANFPTASNTDLANARALYALLTGRITSIPASARLNDAGQYIYNGHIVTKEKLNEYGLFAQDSWRVKPNVTLTVGLRYELQKPMVPISGTYTMATLDDLCGVSGQGNGPGGRYCNMFNPGVANNPGIVPSYTKYDPGHPGYSTDYNNIAPNVGVAWRPNAQTGWLRSFLGDPEQATLSGGFTRAFNRERMDRFVNVIGNNPGGSITATRGTATGNYALVLPGESWPVLYRERNRLGPPVFPATPTFPLIANNSNNVNIFDPKLVTPYTDSWSVGLQRALSRDMVVEARYIGTRNYKAWTTENWNNQNITENGLLDEFKLAQANLQANILAGRGGTFAYFGPGTGTSPLPIFLASFTGTPTSGAGDPTNYTTAKFANAAQFTNNTWVSRLDRFKPDPYGVASNLYTGTSGTWRLNQLAAGFPANYLVVNPAVNNANILRAVGGGHYNSLQVDLRRRFSRGVQVTGSYTFARQWTLTLPTNTGNGPVGGTNDFHFDRFDLLNTNVPHAFKFLWVWDMPFGRGKRYGADWNGLIDGILGGWQFSGDGRVQIQTFRLSNTRLVGMSFDEAQALFKKIRIETDPITGLITVWDMPLDVVDNTRKAYNTSPTSATGYPAGSEPTGRYFAPASDINCIATRLGDCGAPDLYFKGPWLGEFDFKLVKRFRLPSRATFEFDIEVFNMFRANNFTPALNPTNTESGVFQPFKVTATQSGARTGQLVWRVTW